MASDWWSSDGELWWKQDQLTDSEQLDDTFGCCESDLLENNPPREIIDWDGNDEFYRFPEDSRCCTTIFKQDGPTLAELNGRAIDDLDLFDSTFSSKQYMEHLSFPSSVVGGSSSGDNQRQSLRQFHQALPLPLANLKSDASSCFARTSAFCVASANEEKLSNRSTADDNVQSSLILIAPAQGDISHGTADDTVQSSLILIAPTQGTIHNNVSADLKKRKLCSEISSEQKLCESDSCKDVSTAVSHDVGDSLQWLTAVKEEPVNKKLKSDPNVTAVLYSVSRECNQSPVSQSDDSDIENFGDTVSDEDDTAAVFDLNERTLSSCTNVDPQKRYFWLYNVQAKGPKGRTPSSCQTMEGTSTMHFNHQHVLGDPTHMDTSPRGRRGRGSDIDANPRRLLQIGAEINRLSSVVNRLPNSAEASLTAREKNKYASRICRLKRKAQHEANKIKLQGLMSEQNQLMSVLSEIKTCIVQRVREVRQCADQKRRVDSIQPSLSAKLESLVKTHLSDMIAEHTNEYVNCELQKIKNESRNQRL